ncbi:MAG TPA: GNAT family N-acetyltransferase [Pyrinomonadaceae bacterium]|nr:GNAT family N-acetyltransferase [Pyrinomonadaceae bacterium]
MAEITIRECSSIQELDHCVLLQRDVFGLPDLEISPRRHLIVSRQAGGWTLGAFAENRLVGFVHHLTGVRNGNEVFGYSHMMAVDREYQNKGVGARLKWSQRARALEEGRSFIKWTWDPMQARNAHFNLNRLGVVVSSYGENFYGTDYPVSPVPELPGIDSDRLFAGWQIRSNRVERLGQGESVPITAAPEATIKIPSDWTGLLKSDPHGAKRELLRARGEFHENFGKGLVCAGFQRGDGKSSEPQYLLYRADVINEVNEKEGR